MSRIDVERRGERMSDGEVRTIVVAEDEPAVRDLILITLRRNGYHALAAVDGRDAMRIIERLGDAVDLLISDLVMPGVGGLELVALARAQLPRLPIVLITGYSQVQLPRGAENITLLAKPFTARGLIGAVRGASGEI